MVKEEVAGLYEDVMRLLEDIALKSAAETEVYKMRCDLQ